MKIFITTALTFCFVLLASFAVEAADDNLSFRLKGRLLLQAEEKGQAWYLNPADLKKYELGRPQAAFNIMRELGIGITNADLEKIPLGGLNNLTGTDSDSDGLSDLFEDAIKTNKKMSDTDGDGYNDKLELENNYSPVVKKGKLPISQYFTNLNKGKIFLQVENNGEAWYVNPTDGRRYFLGRPADAFQIMRSLSLGITNADLEKIAAGYLAGKKIEEEGGAPTPPSPPQSPPPVNLPEDQSGDNTPQAVMSSVSIAIMENNKAKALTYFTPEAQNAAEYTLNFLNSDSKFTLGNIMSGASLSSAGAEQYIYTITVNLGGYINDHNFYIKKQPDGSWLLDNL